MKQRLKLSLTLLLACLLPVSVVAKSAQELEAELLQTAQMWDGKNRPDLARQFLNKLLAIRPDSPLGLVLMAELALRENQPEQASKLLATLHARYPGNAATRDIETLLRVYGPEREKLARLRLMVRAGSKADAQQLAKTRDENTAQLAKERQAQTVQLALELFPDGPPALGALRREYDLIMQANAAAQKPVKPQSRLAAQKSGRVARKTIPAPRPGQAQTPPGLELEPMSLRFDTNLALREHNIGQAQLLSTQAEKLIAANELNAALQALQEAVELTPQDAWLRHRLARLYLRLNLPGRARQVMDEGVAAAADDYDMLFARALIRSALDDDAAALTDLALIPPPARSESMLALEQQIKDRMRQSPNAAALASTARQPWLEVSQQRLQKSATSGISTLNGWERPLVVWLPTNNGQRYFLHADQVQLGAGPLSASDASANGFGQIAPQQVASVAAAANAQTATALNLGIGYEGEQLHWDLGAIGVGFAVSNIVGGISQRLQAGPYSTQLEVARRPLTGTLLSYAGTRDPVSGEVWGGVVATGVGARVATQIDHYSVSTSANYALLSGRNIANNHRAQMRLAADRDLAMPSGQQLNLALALSLWHYQQDLSQFTLGHGGYYSPQRYLSVSLPLEWNGRQGALTWLVRSAVGLSYSASNQSAYFPGNAALQQQAGNGFYAGSSGAGRSFSLRAAIEYQLTPKIALGSQLELERSAYYAPNNLLLYLRYWFGPGTASLESRPRPVQPYSSF